MAHAGQMILCRELHPFPSSPQVCGGVFLHGAGHTNDYIPVFSNNQCTVHLKDTLCGMSLSKQRSTGVFSDMAPATQIVAMPVFSNN